MSKEEVKRKIIKYCKEYGIKIPDFNNYKEVKAACDKLNKTCRFCGKYKGADMGVICVCELTSINMKEWQKEFDKEFLGIVGTGWRMEHDGKEISISILKAFIQKLLDEQAVDEAIKSARQSKRKKK